MNIKNYNNYENLYPMHYVNDYISQKGQHKKQAIFVCCHCGCIKMLRIDRAKKLKSCGCVNGCVNSGRFKVGNTINTTHGKSDTRLYHIHQGIKKRCLDKNNNNYELYGGRGIKICDDWLNNFYNFEKWSLNNGYSDNLSIDRIDVNGNYEPSNCRWATFKEQNNNRRSNTFLSLNNEKLSLKMACEKYGVNYNTAKNNIRKNTENKEIIFMNLVNKIK